MLVSVELPDAIAKQLHLDGEQGSIRALEMLALEGFRSGRLSRGQVSELLNQSFCETEAFLKRFDCGLGHTFEEHEACVQRLRLLASDMLAYKRHSEADRRAALEELTAQAQELGMGY